MCPSQNQLSYKKISDSLRISFKLDLIMIKKIRSKLKMKHKFGFISFYQFGKIWIFIVNYLQFTIKEN